MKIVLSCFILTAMLVTIACQQRQKTDCIDESKIDSTKICTMDYRPVCGCDNITYSNSCEAEKKGVAKWLDGPCKTEEM